MKLKRTIRISLLLFVSISIAYFAYDEIDLLHKSSKTRESVLKEIDDPSLPKDYVVLYYFHGTIRCKACLEMETNAKRVIESYFPSQYEAGILRWKVANIDLPENYHYLEDYIIMYNTLVIQEFIDDKPGEWKELWHAWELSEKKAQYIEYIRNEIASFLEVN
ncbi:nitrophenyl compound nitroreductase subunit ArsF family protein [Mesotoga sp. B105.6.4]|uniref:nitrophenyl compound nitroreductase subunit ArsF family protein n=1 Tax=Mesotoga sp. B105.6.4 TaxID=1582224 RepID=UPI000CCC9075|nr:nitrophenyl compound nitroreductase subunit ArsF family protein [Mesotoga sp. B105.6.4]